MNRGFFRFPVLVIEWLKCLCITNAKKRDEEIRVICDVDDGCGISERTAVVATPEVGMMAVKRGGDVYINEQKPTWNTRWKVGVGVEFAVRPDRFSLKSGLYYTQRGYSRHSILFGSVYPTTDDQSKPTLMKVIIKRIVIFCRFR